MGTQANTSDISFRSSSPRSSSFAYILTVGPAEAEVVVVMSWIAVFRRGGGAGAEAAQLKTRRG